MGALLAVITPFLEQAALALAGKGIDLLEMHSSELVKEFLAQPAVQAQIHAWEAQGVLAIGHLVTQGFSWLHAELDKFLKAHPKVGLLLSKMEEAEKTPAGGLVVSLAADELKALWAMKGAGEWARCRAWLGLP